ncbi:hypothetical protein C8Q74DRAFT_1314617 [Fomes fomentarius]|nr:hypothetical protein C8Q74DRAFT_1314617 [Fomes fomentarius]
MSSLTLPSAPNLGSQPQCPGCCKTFTMSGLSNHLAQTRKPQCIAVRKTMQSSATPAGQAVPPASATPLDASIPPLDVNMDNTHPVPFEGDFFGDYDPSFFDDDNEDHDYIPPSLFLPFNSEFSEDEAARLGTSPSPCNIPGITATSTHVVQFPAATAGAPIPGSHAAMTANHTYLSRLSGSSASESRNLYAPFNSQTDWEVARWGKLRGAQSTAFTDLLAIEGIAEKLALSYKNSRELNTIIDKKLPSVRPRFQRHEIVIAGESFDVHYRNIIECIEALWGDPDFTPLLLLVPERHYADPEHKIHVYFDMNTGKWWWSTQEQLEAEHPRATVVPIIISSDKTQLTLIGNKTAYPVYMTLGNLPKDIRCKPSRHAACRRTIANLFHTCMSHVLEPLKDVGITGILLTSGDGVWRHGHPILATYVADYQEQVLVTGIKTGECPKCLIPCTEVGESLNTERPFQKLEDILDALDAINDGPRIFAQACRDVGIKPLYHPFWQDLLYTNIFYAITPDLLHLKLWSHRSSPLDDRYHAGSMPIILCKHLCGQKYILSAHWYTNLTQHGYIAMEPRRDVKVEPMCIVTWRSTLGRPDMEM